MSFAPFHFLFFGSFEVVIACLLGLEELDVVQLIKILV